jgi:hypothetical protein
MAHQPFTPDASQSAAAVPMDSTPTENERDTDALVANFGSEAPAECAPKQAPRDASVFRILRVAAGTIFGSVASVVFFANLFFINIGTNVVEGLVRAISKTAYDVCAIECAHRAARCSCSSRMSSGQAVRF